MLRFSCPMRSLFRSPARSLQQPPLAECVCGARVSGPSGPRRVRSGVCPTPPTLCPLSLCSAPLRLRPWPNSRTHSRSRLVEGLASCARFQLLFAAPPPPCPCGPLRASVAQHANVNRRSMIRALVCSCARALVQLLAHWGARASRAVR